MKSASCWFHYTEIKGKRENKKKFIQSDEEAIDSLKI
jgi:hypothetical protein